MKPIVTIALAFVLLVPSTAFAVDYRDSTGYTPSWAQGAGYHSVLLQCTELTGDYSSDGNWCFEWTAYVLDQGVENFPESTKSTSSPKSFKLEDGPLYSGNLVNFLPHKSNYGSDWQVGKPFTMENLEQMKSGGLMDFVSQRIVIPDLLDKTNFLKISYMIMELENEKSASEFYSKTKESIYSQNFPNRVEYFELYDQGIWSDKLELERSSEYAVADCIGQIINFDRENEEAKFTCIKENYIVSVMATWKTALYNPSFTLGGTESTVDEYSEIMVKNIENNSQDQPVIYEKSSQEDEFFPIDEMKPEVTSQPTQTQNIEKSTSDIEVTTEGMIIALFVVFVLPIIIIVLIIWKIKQRRKKKF
jgi:hypothetical protein